MGEYTLQFFCFAAHGHATYPQYFPKKDERQLLVVKKEGELIGISLANVIVAPIDHEFDHFSWLVKPSSVELTKLMLAL